MAGAETLRILETTREQWVKGFSDETEEDHPILAALKSKGNLDKQASGTKFKKSIKYKRRRLTGYGDMQNMTWERQNLYKTATQEWRALQISDAFSEKEFRMNRGDEARVRLFADKLNSLKDDANADVGTFLYADGNAIGNEEQPHGFLSFMGYTSGSQNLADAFASVPTDTYMGLSTALGNYGGSGTYAGEVWKSDDPEYDFWTPVIVNSTWSDGTARTWAADAVEAIGRAISHAQRATGKKHQLDMFTMTRSNYFTLKEQLRSKERIIVNPGKDRSLLVSLGFTNVIQIDGVDCTVDTDVPATDNAGNTLRACGWNMSQVMMCLLPSPDQSMHGKTVSDVFWNDSGMAFDEDQKVYKVWLGLFGNMVAYPRYQAMISDIGGS